MLLIRVLRRRPLTRPFVPTRAYRASAALALTLTCACAGPQSALTPAGRDAEDVFALFGWLAGGAAVIWVAVIGLTIYSLRKPSRHPERAARRLIIGGVVFTTVVLAGVLVYALALMPRMLAPAPPGALRIDVVGEQWWWRVHYAGPGGPIPTANEIRLPVGERVNVRLYSADVIHSFWVPSIAGKMDMFPGRETRLALEPTRTGVFRGACAEYCGTSHGLMNFDVVVMERAAFDAWLAAQARPAAPAASAAAAAGREVFEATGCGACHTIRGTAADGLVGPDLTHVGGRQTLGASLLPNDAAAFARWIADVDRLKPGAHMPAFGMLPDDDVRALAAYLDSLQ